LVAQYVKTQQIVSHFVKKPFLFCLAFAELMWAESGDEVKHFQTGKPNEEYNFETKKKTSYIEGEKPLKSPV